jgi:predicted CXXCH cytochrome family protein
MRAPTAAVFGAALVAAILACAHGAAPAPRHDPVAAATAAGVTNPHAPRADGKPFCGRCHAPGEARTVGDPITLCAQCHDAARMQHPFRVAMEKLPEGLPLMEGGYVACHTCHDPHDVGARKGGLRLAFKELCVRCHGQHGTSPQDNPHKRRPE